jgi:hypothetical protein
VVGGIEEARMARDDGEWLAVVLRSRVTVALLANLVALVFVLHGDQRRRAVVVGGVEEAAWPGTAGNNSPLCCTRESPSRF